ncbi:HAMP domain-containing histidine kinase [candidate division WOR-3 bacterium]|nr:HAMP domain-containing histidine kinase [candidate division WOR-3 bacterium]
MKSSYPRTITIVAVVFIACILFLAAVNLYVGIRLRNELIAQDQNTIISVATLCGLFMRTNQTDPGLFFQLKNIHRAFEFDHMIISDTSGSRHFDSHVLKPQYMPMHQTIDFSNEFERMPGEDELVRRGSTFLYRSSQPAFYFYASYSSSYLATYDVLFRWHLFYITFSLFFIGFLGIFLIRNLFMPMRYVTRLAKDLGVETHKEDFVSETFSEIFKKMKVREQTLVEFSAYIAHEFRNSIGAISGLARLVEKGKKGATEIVKECKTMEQLINRLLEYSKPLDMVQGEFDIADLLATSIERSRPPKYVTIQKKIDLQRSRFIGDHGLLVMALANLLKNSYEAIEDKGIVAISASVVNDHLVITVTDTGKGLDAKEMERIFTPFYSGKANGMGLGLAYVSRVIELHNGRIQVESTPGKGTTFTIRLPQ